MEPQVRVPCTSIDSETTGKARFCAINRYARYSITLVRVTTLLSITEFGRGEIKGGALSYEV
jgi:hypothetical protein